MRQTLLWLGILGGAIPALAQSPLPPLSDTILVTASLVEEDRDELPVSADVIEAEEIESRQLQEVADALRTVAGLDVVRSGSPGHVTSLFTRGTESDHTLVLWNGVELNDPYFGGFDWGFLPTDGVSRIEVVRGPFSALHGSDALGGVVQVLSGVSDRGKLDLEAGGHGHALGRLAAGLTRGDFRLELMGHLRRDDGRTDNDFYDGESVALRAAWIPRPGWSLGVTARGADSEVGIPESFGQVTPLRRRRLEERQVAVPFEITAGPWHLEAQLSGTRATAAFRDPNDSFGFTASDTESQRLHLRSVLSRHFGAGRWLAVGAESERQRVDSSSVFGVDLDGERQRTTAVFAEVFHTVGRLRLDLGLRHDDNDVYGGATTPKAGLALDLGGGRRLRAAYGEGFRAPSIGELFFPGSGNPALEPERSKSLEVGFEQRAGRFELTLTAFRNDLENLIDFDFATFSNVNVGRARTRGLEARTAWTGDRWSGRFNGTLLDADDLDSGERLLRRPRFRSSAVVSRETGPWEATLTARWVGERPDVDPLTSARTDNPAYLTVDLAGRWRREGRLEPYARVENIADREYSEALGFPAPGRTFIGGVAIGF